MTSSPSVTKLRYADLLDAFEFASAGGPIDSAAYIDRDTGATHFVSPDFDFDEELPPDLETSDRYISVPNKYDLDLGRHLVLSFIDRELPNDYGTVAAFFRKKGAYARFKNFLETRRLLQRWYDFRALRIEEALREWCRDNGIAIIDEASTRE